MAILSFQKPDKVIMLEADDIRTENSNSVRLNLAMVLLLATHSEGYFFLHLRVLQ